MELRERVNDGDTNVETRRKRREKQTSLIIMPELDIMVLPHMMFSKFY